VRGVQHEEAAAGTGQAAPTLDRETLAGADAGNAAASRPHGDDAAGTVADGRFQPLRAVAAGNDPQCGDLPDDRRILPGRDLRDRCGLRVSVAELAEAL